jgi:hypothetical protein
LCCWLILSCKEPNPSRNYEEIIISPKKKSSPSSFTHSSAQSLDASRSLQDFKKANLKWVTPEGWLEKPGRGMRIATFLVMEQGDTAECAMIRLPDSGGGLASNVKRWMQQLSIIVPPEKQFHKFLTNQQRFKTAGGFSGILVNFTSLLSGDLTSDRSALTAFIPVNNNTVFLTLFGSKRLLGNNQDKLLSLCRSLNIED